MKRFTCPGWDPSEQCGVEFDVVVGHVVECLDVGWHRVTDEDMVEMKGDELLCGGRKWARLAEVEAMGYGR